MKVNKKGSKGSLDSDFASELLEDNSFSVSQVKGLDLNDESLYYVNIKKEAKRLRIDQKTIDNKLLEYQYVVSKIEEFWEDYGKTKGENIHIY